MNMLDYSCGAIKLNNGAKRRMKTSGFSCWMDFGLRTFWTPLLCKTHSWTPLLCKTHSWTPLLCEVHGKERMRVEEDETGNANALVGGW